MVFLDDGFFFNLERKKLYRFDLKGERWPTDELSGTRGISFLLRRGEGPIAAKRWASSRFPSKDLASAIAKLIENLERFEMMRSEFALLAGVRHRNRKLASGEAEVPAEEILALVLEELPKKIGNDEDKKEAYWRLLAELVARLDSEKSPKNGVFSALNSAFFAESLKLGRVDSMRLAITGAGGSTGGNGESSRMWMALLEAQTPGSSQIFPTEMLWQAIEELHRDPNVPRETFERLTANHLISNLLLSELFALIEDGILTFHSVDLARLAVAAESPRSNLTKNELLAIVAQIQPNMVKEVAGLLFPKRQAKT